MLDSRFRRSLRGDRALDAPMIHCPPPETDWERTMGESGNRGIDVARASEASLDPEGLRRAFGLLESWIDEGVLPGAAALVARGGRIAGEAYLGVANRAKEQPVTSDTIWSLASVTKPFTATAVMILVERGVISLDDPLYRLVPAFLRAPTTAFDRRLVTVRHLLAHCSGLPGFSPDNTALRQEHRPLEDFVRSFGSQPLFFTPGAFHLYSNPGILMAAEVVGRAVAGALGVETDEPLVGRYHPFVDEEILAPLGMTLSALRPPAAWDNRIAWVERTGQEGLDWEGANSTYYRSLGIPWGGMFSRPRDLVRFVDLFLPRAGGRQRIGLDPESAIDAPRIVSPATAHEMISIQ